MAAKQLRPIIIMPVGKNFYITDSFCYHKIMRLS